MSKKNLELKKIICSKETKKYIKNLLGFMIVIVGLFLLMESEVQNKIHLAGTYLVIREINRNSRGLNFFLGENLSEEDMGENFTRGYKCTTEDWAGDSAGIPDYRGYFLEENIRQGIQVIGVRKFPDYENSMQKITYLCLTGREYKLYGIQEGTTLEKAEKILKKYGYAKAHGEYWKAGVKITLYENEGCIGGIKLWLYSRTEQLAIMRTWNQARKVWSGVLWE